MNDVNKQLWLFARPIKKDVQTYADYVYNEKNVFFGFEEKYINNYGPCLVLKNLFADLFKGNRSVCSLLNKEDQMIYFIEKLIDENNIKGAFVEYFFPFFSGSRKEYLSRFNTKTESGKNPCANYLYSHLQSEPMKIIIEMDRTCDHFFTHDCVISPENKVRLNEYLLSRLNIYIDYIINTRYKFPPFVERDPALKASVVERLRGGLEAMRGNLTLLLSRLLILAGLCWNRIDSEMLEVLLVNTKVMQYKCDKLYVEYCEENKTDVNKLHTAHKSIDKNAKYYKEIVCDSAVILMDSKDEQSKRKVYGLLKNLVRSHKDYGRAHYLLAICFENGTGCTVNLENAEKHYQKAAELRDADAMLTLAQRAFHSSDYNKAVEYCKSILALYPSADNRIVGRAAFIIAEIALTKNNDEIIAKHYYEISAKASYSPAKHKLRLLNRPNRSSANAGINDQEKENNNTENNNIIAIGCEDAIESIRAGLRSCQWQMNLITEGSGNSGIRRLIDEYLEKYSKTLPIEKLPDRSVFVFAETDEELNLRNTLYLLDRLYGKYIEIISPIDDYSEERAQKLMKSFDIYISSDYEMASTVIDASLEEMGEDVYFMVHICDINKSHAEQLIYRAPLFIPCLKNNGNNPNVVTFGNSDFIYSFIREATASCFMKNHPVSISAIGKDISLIENRFKQNCGGIFTVNLENKIVPGFYEYDTRRADLDDIASDRLTSYDAAIGKIIDVINKGNYFVVDVGSDVENLLFAKNLRTWLLRSNLELRRLPFIAVRCKDSVNAFWIKRLHSGGHHEQHWYNDYDLYIFGMMSDIYPSVITSNLIERIALGIHLSYGKESDEKEIMRFWQSSYRRDSSRATAVGLVYRLLEGDVYLYDYREYHNIDFDTLAEMSSEFDKGVKNITAKMEHLAQVEQARWNCFMLTRGWLSATPEQVRCYCKSTGKLSHKHNLAKLHPYICDWKYIRIGEDGVPAKIKELVPHAPCPRESTLNSIKRTKEFFKEIPAHSHENGSARSNN